MGTSRVQGAEVCELRAGWAATAQVSRTVHGTKKDALRVTAESTVGRAGRAAGRSVSDADSVGALLEGDE